MRLKLQGGSVDTGRSVTFYQRYVRGLVLALLLPLVLAIGGCARGPGLVEHSFGFDAAAESPDIEVLDYRYGHSNAPGTKMPDWVKSSIGASGGTSTSGAMVIGDALYVKWRIKATGEVLEDTVDLKSRLPRDITDHRIYFVIHDRQLFVYLVSSERRPADFPIVGPKKFQFYKVYAIYPNPTLKP